MLVLCSDFAMIFLITRRWHTTLGLVIATNLASTSLYFLHERLWNKIDWGRTAQDESHANHSGTQDREVLRGTKRRLGVP